MATLAAAFDPNTGEHLAVPWRVRSNNGQLDKGEKEKERRMEGAVNSYSFWEIMAASHSSRQIGFLFQNLKCVACALGRLITYPQYENEGAKQKEKKTEVL